MYRLANLHLSLGEYQTAIEFCRGVAEDDRESSPQFVGPTPTFFSSACGYLSWMSALTGDFPKALIYAMRGLHAADTSGSPHGQAISYTFRAAVPLYQGHFRDSLSWCERSLHMCESKQVTIWLPTAHSVLGWALAKAGRPQEGLPHLELGVTLGERNGQKTLLSLLYFRWAEGLLLSGDLSEAKHIANRGLELAKTNEERGVEAETLELLGEIASAEEPTTLDATDRLFERAKTLAAELGMRPLVARCHLGLGKLYRRTSKRDQALEHLTTATTMYREMDMRWWADQADAEGAALMRRPQPDPSDLAR
jgi:tetratricopeptide (TPR) repeat protein